MADKVTLDFAVSGIQEAKQDVDSLAASLAGVFAGINGGAGGAPGAGATSKPVGAPAIVPGATNPLGSYAPVNGAGGMSSLNVSGLGGTLMPGGTFGGGGVSPGMITPPPLPHAGYGPPPPTASAGGGGNGGGPIQVQIVASIPLTFANGGGGGAGGQGGGGYGAGGGQGGGVGIPMGGGGGTGGAGGGAPSPFGSGFNPFQPGGMANIGSLAQTALGYAHNPSALMGLIPAPFALAGAAVTTGFQAAEANFSAYRPTYDLETSLAAAPMRGQMISPLLKPGMSKVAEDQGNLNYYESHRNTIYGWAGRIGSLGAADWYYNTHIKPGLDRKLALDSAESDANPMRLRFSAATGMMPGDDGALSIKNSLYGAAGGFGTGAISSLQNNGGFKSMVDSGWGSDDAAGVASVVYGAASRQQSGALYGQIKGGGDAIGMATAVLPSLIASGDTASINALRPKIGNAATDAAITQARNTFQLGVTTQIDQATSGAAGAQVSMLGATGAGYRQISSAIGTQAGTMDAIRGDLTQRMALATAAGNTGEAAQINTQILQLNAQQAATQKSAIMNTFSGRGTDNQALSLGASNTMYQATYGVGTQGAVDLAFGADRAAKVAEAQRLEDMSRSSVIPPEQRAVYVQQARQMRQQATIGVDRDKNQYDYSMEVGRLGLQDAKANAGQVNASLYGNSGDIYQAAIVSTNVTQGKLAAVTGQLSDPKAHLSAEQRQDLETKQISLQTDLNKSLEDARRSFLGLNVSVAQTTQGIASMQGSIRMQYEHLGGADASGVLGTNAAAAGDTLAAAQKDFNYYDRDVKSGKMRSDAPEYLRAKQALTSAQAGQMGALSSYESAGNSLKNQNALVDASYALQMSAIAPNPRGNVRGAYESQMTAYGDILSDNKKLEAMQIQGYRDAAKKYGWTDKQLNDRIAGAQLDWKQKDNSVRLDAGRSFQAYSSDWQSRLISQTVGSTSRDGFVSSQFSMREAAPLIAALGGDDYNGYFGFGGGGAGASRDKVMGQYSRLSGPNIGGINTSADFIGTALSGAMRGTGGSLRTPNGSIRGVLGDGTPQSMGVPSPGGLGGTLRAPEIRVIVEDHRVTVSSGGRTASATMGKGGNAPTIASLAAGADVALSNPHNKGGGSHQ